MRKRKSSGKLKLFIVSLILILLVVFSINITDFVLKKLYPITYSEYVDKYSSEYNIDRNLVFSIIKAESSFNSKAVSPRKAKGLMQIMDSTGKWAAEKIKIENYETGMLLQPDANIRIGCWYIARLLKQYNQDTELALAAYNAGSGNVSEWLNDVSISSDGKTLDRIPFEETKNYISRIKKFHNMYKKLYDGQK